MRNKSAEWTGKMRNEKCGILASYFGENSKKLLLERNFWQIIQINNNNLEDVQFYLNSLPITSDKIQ